MRALIFTVLWALPHTAGAHGLGHEEAIGWSWEPEIVDPLVLALAVFGAGWTRLHGRSAQGRQGLRRQAAWFAAGWLILAAAMVSPLHAGGERSFALHMTEHELLMLAAAPALVLSRPLAVMLWAWPAPVRRGLGRLVAARLVADLWRRVHTPVPATLVQAAVLWLWHAPALFDRALAAPGWHAAQHLSFLLAALLFWSAVLPRGTDAAGRAVAALCLFLTSVVSGALGALMAVSGSPWYAGYSRIGMAPLGLGPVEDQQVAGLIMWVPGGLVHALAALAVVRGILREGRMEGAHAI